MQASVEHVSVVEAFEVESVTGCVDALIENLIISTRTPS